MKKFLKKVFIFLVPALTVLIIGLLLPPTPRAKTSLLFSKISKDQLLVTIDAPRLIFVGGSNLSFGIDSQLIKEKLCLNPVNTGIHASLGLLYMMDSVLPFIREGDVVVVSPEYDHFFGNFAFGGEELLRMLVDIAPHELTLMRIHQALESLRYLPKFSLSKFKPTEYFFNIPEGDVYSVDAFNSYGDVDRHWSLPRKSVAPYPLIKGEINDRVFEELHVFQKALDAKNARLWIAFPALQDKSYEISKNKILMVKERLVNEKFSILGRIEKYIISDSMTFDTPYHLNRAGVILRTTQLIADLKEAGVFFEDLCE